MADNYVRIFVAIGQFIYDVLQWSYSWYSMLAVPKQFMIYISIIDKNKDFQKLFQDFWSCSTVELQRFRMSLLMTFNASFYVPPDYSYLQRGQRNISNNNVSIFFHIQQFSYFGSQKSYIWH